MMMPDRIAIVRTLLICLLSLAVLGFRAPAADTSGLIQVASVESDHVGHSHDHHGHLHDDEDEPTATSGHDRFHVGDHSHDTPTAAVLTGFGFSSPRDSGPGMPDDRITSRPTPPGDRPPREA